VSEPGLTEVAERVFVLRYPVLDVNVTLIPGAEVMAVVDTLSTPTQAGIVRRAARRIAGLPIVVVNTHHHFDHSFGNASLDATAIYSHPEAAARLTATDPHRVHREWGAHDPELDELAAVTVVVPDRLVPHETGVDLGGREIVLHFLGRGHTAGDLVVHVPDADLVVAGDLVEESGPPSFEDGYPLEWPETLAALVALGAHAVVPGHGAPVDVAFVRAAHDDLAALAWLIRDGHADGAPREAVVAKAPFPVDTAAVAVARGYAELAGTA
jgi:glyoxylase-like metal-dependent hydrolase (beta-lactamase superfamily II)